MEDGAKFMLVIGIIVVVAAFGISGAKSGKDKMEGADKNMTGLADEAWKAAGVSGTP